MKSEEIKLEAREGLIGARSKGIGLLAASLAASFAFPSFMLADRLLPGWDIKPVWLTAAAIVLLPVRAFVKYPMRNYTWEWFISRASGTTPPRVKNSFLPRRAFAGVLLGLALAAIRVGIAAAFLLLPSAACALLALRAALRPMSLPVLITLAGAAALSLLVGAVFAAYAVQYYSCASYYFAACPGISVRAALNMSRSNMRGRCLSMLMFKLSFLPWLLPCVLIFPAGYVWAYYKQSLTCRIIAW